MFAYTFEFLRTVT